MGCRWYRVLGFGVWSLGGIGFRVWGFGVWSLGGIGALGFGYRWYRV